VPLAELCNGTNFEDVFERGSPESTLGDDLQGY